MYCLYLKCFDCTNNVLSLFPLYFCFPDLLLIFYYWKAIGDKFFVVHHLAALYAYYYVLVSALLSNSRTCRQDGRETTKGEQPCPVTLSVLTNFSHHFSKWRRLPPCSSYSLAKYAQGKVSIVSICKSDIPQSVQTHQRRKHYGCLKSTSLASLLSVEV